MTKYKVYIGKLPKEAETSEIEKEFSKFGKIDHIEARTGYAFVEYSEKKDAEDAIDKMHDEKFQDSRLIVEWANERRDRRDRDSGKGPSTKDICYNCGKRGHCLRRIDMKVVCLYEEKFPS